MQSVEREEVLGKLQKIENLLKTKELKPFNSAKASQYLHISVSHLYKLTSKRKIPFHKPNGKHLYFYADELDEWITSTFRRNSMTLPLSDQESNNQILEDEEIEPP